MINLKFLVRKTGAYRYATQWHEQIWVQWRNDFFTGILKRKLENLTLPNLNHLLAGVTIENYATFSCLSWLKLHDIVCALWHDVMVSNDAKLCVDFRHNMFATS